MAAESERDEALGKERAGESAFLGVRFDCCGVYQRIYRNRAGDAYVGWCPRCARQVRVAIDPAKGSDGRFFRAS